MTITALHVSLGATHPVKLLLLIDGRVVFQRIRPIPSGAMFDSNATFYDDSFFLRGTNGGEEYPYGMALPYKQLPLLKQWLIDQRLPSPV